ncbi:hypothetical protein Chor_005242 [Crotalus horridus]
MVLDRNGQTALHLACEYGSLRCLRELLEGSPAGLDLEARNFEVCKMRNLLYNRIALEYRKIIICFHETLRGPNPLPVSELLVSNSVPHCLYGNSDFRASILMFTTDIKSGRSPLLHAVENNNLDMVELLLQHGANVNAQSYGGNTALHTASGRGLLDMLRLLVRNGADGGLKNYHNDTALMAIDILRGKASRPIPHPESSHDGSSPTISAASSPGVRTHPHVLHASPDSCSTIPSPDQTPKPHRAGHSPNTTALRPESIIVTNEPLTSAPLPGMELERSSHSSTLEQPMGFPRSSKGLLRENMTDPAFHTVPLYPFSPSSPHVSSHHLQLLPMGLNHPALSMPPGCLTNRMSMRYPGMDQSQRLLDSEGPAVLGCEGQWLHSSDNGPGGS